MFDEDTKDRNNELKMTADKRYENNYPDISIDENYVIDDWALIFKNQNNKKRFKLLFRNVVMQSVVEWLDEGQIFYINGVFPEGETKKFIKTEFGYLTIETVEHWKLPKAESDTKIFNIIETLHNDLKVLIFSLDTDVKILAVYWSARIPNKNIVIRSGSGVTPSYFHPQKFVEFMERNYKLETTMYMNMQRCF